MKKISLILIVFLLLFSKLLANEKNKFDFLLIDTRKENKKLNITKEYVKEKFILQYYKFNEDKQINFDFGTPKNWLFTPNIEEGNLLTKNKNRLALLGIIDTENKDVIGFIYGSFLNKEINSRDYGEIIIQNEFNAEIVFENTSITQSGADSDFVAINKNKNIIRGITFKDGNYYYLFFYFSKNINDYLKNIKDINISLQSFRLKNKTNKIYSIDFVDDKILVNGHYINFSFPKGSIISKKVGNNEVYIKLKVENGTTFLINILPDTDFTPKEIANDFMEQLKNNKIMLSDVNDNNFRITKNNNIFYDIDGTKDNTNFILSGRAVKRNNRVINVAALNVDKKIANMMYYENKRIINIILDSIHDI